jgi:hypothetical protein
VIELPRITKLLPTVKATRTVVVPFAVTTTGCVSTILMPLRDALGNVMLGVLAGSTGRGCGGTERTA